MKFCALQESYEKGSFLSGETTGFIDDNLIDDSFNNIENPLSHKYSDLHLHTTEFYGALTPREVVCAAKELGLSVIAITDHDTVNGIAEAIEAGMECGLEVIPGIEISAIDGEREVHILGYYIYPDSKDLLEILSQMIDARDTRAIQMVEKLNGLGGLITLDRVCEISGNQFNGRPHIADAMLEAGYITERAEAVRQEVIIRIAKA